MYTPEQEKKALKLMAKIEDDIQEIIYYLTAPYQSINDLTNDPEALENILNLNRTKDMCFIYLITNHQGHVGYTLENEPSDVIDYVLTKNTQDFIELFNQDNIIKNYIFENEYNINNQFKNDAMYQTIYKEFITK